MKPTAGRPAFHHGFTGPPRQAAMSELSAGLECDQLQLEATENMGRSKVLGHLLWDIFCTHVIGCRVS